MAQDGSAVSGQTAAQNAAYLRMLGIDVNDPNFDIASAIKKIQDDQALSLIHI